MSLTSNIIESNQNTKSFYISQNLSPAQRCDLALKAISGCEIKKLAQKNGVSRKFIYEQKTIAMNALHGAFGIEKEADENVLFVIPVTAKLIRQWVIGLTLVCHSSERGVVEFLRDFVNYEISTGTVHNILAEAAKKACEVSQKYDLSLIKHAAHDEIFQNNKPVLTGVDVESGFIYLLKLEDSRDATTWGFRLLQCKERGLNPDIFIADGGTGLRAGQAEVFPGIPCDSDVFHVLNDLFKVGSTLEKRAYKAIDNVYDLEKKLNRIKNKNNELGEDLLRAGSKKNHNPKTSLKINKLEKEIMNNEKQYNEFCAALSKARITEKNAIDFVDTITIITQWMQHDILSKVGASYAERSELFDFATRILDEKSALSHHIKKINTKLKNQRDDLLRFAERVDKQIIDTAKKLNIDLPTMRNLYELQGISFEKSHRWEKEKKIRSQLGERFYLVELEVKKIIKETIRASSIVENRNSCLRPYFFLRKSFGPESLDLLQFYLNHKTFMRSAHSEKVGKSPAELLFGKTHPHWIEMLGYTQFKKSIAQA